MGGVPTRARKPMMTGTGQPTVGWIRTMREARKLSLRQLGERLGVQGNSVHVAERRERSGGISLYQLQRIAAALDCDLFYAFVPRQQPRKRAREDISETTAPAAPTAP